MRARDFMTHPAITINVEATAADAARVMVEQQIDCLPVVDATGALLGIVTSSDYATKDEGIPFSIIRAPQLFGQWLPPGGIEEVYRTARATPIRALMQPGVITCDESASLDDVVRMFVDRNVHHVVVARERKPVGIVARHDLLRAMARVAEAVA